jgi:hypothetical protein
MAELPFLVVHGWWISKLLVLASGALGLAVIRALRRRADRKGIELELLARTAALCGLVDGTVSVRGRLRGRAKTAFALDGKPTHERGETVTVEVEGQPVSIRDEICVVRGSRAHASFRRGRTFEVGDGDDVIVRGTLRHVASEGGDYRESAGEWVFDGPVELFAARAAIRPPALSPVRSAMYAVFYGVIGYCVLWGLGDGLLRASKVDDSEPRLTRISTAVAIASAMPHVRDDALRELETDLEYHFVRSEDSEQLYVEAVGLRRGCDARAYAEIHTLRFEDAVATAKACGARATEAEALGYLGRYDEAAALAKSPQIAIAAGRWADAAAAADDLHARLAADPASDAQTQARLEGRMECFSLWFHAKAGDAAARAKLGELAHERATCDVANALMAPIDQRAGLLAAASNHEHADGELGLSILPAALAWSYGSNEREYASDTYETIEALIGRSSYDRYLWLAKLGLAAHPDDRIALAYDAALAALEGDQARATREIREAQTKLDDRDDPSDVVPVAQAIALHAPGTIPAEPSEFLHPGIAPLVALRDGAPTGELDTVTLECNRELQEALTTAAAGNGAPLGRLLRSCRMLFDGNAGFILAVAPRVTSNRAELAAGLRVFHDGLGPSSYGAPFSEIVEAAARRDLARMAGDEASAARWQRIVTAQAKLLGDREKLEALLLWEEI